MHKTVSFAGSQEGEVFSFVFCDASGNQYFLCELKCPVHGMNPLIYDQIANLKNIKVETKNFDGKEYITKVLVSKKNLR